MDGPRNYHAKLGSETQISYAITYIWNLKKKKGYSLLICRTETDSQTLKNLWSPKEIFWQGGRMDSGFGMEMF